MEVTATWKTVLKEDRGPLLRNRRLFLKGFVLGQVIDELSRRPVAEGYDVKPPARQ